MSSDAIGGELEGAELVELPISEKTTWGDWSKRYPDSLVLSIEGREHEPENRYDNYLASEDTFRDMEVEDDRLPPKESIYTFFLDETPYAAPHSSIEGGRLFRLEDGRRLFLYREPGVSMFASSRAWVVDAGALAGASPEDAARIHSALAAGELSGTREIGGFDTFWYSWVAINEDTELLR